jgi:hypothetical protein
MLKQGVAGASQATLTWSANGSGGRAITGYKLYRSSSENGTYTLIASPSGFNYIDVGLTEGQTYWYKVSAVSAAGEGTLSPAISLVIPQSFAIWILIVAVIVIGVVLVAVLMVMRNRKGKK